MGEDCAGFIHDGLWNDFFCEDLINYICEKDMERGVWAFFGSSLSRPDLSMGLCGGVCFYQRVANVALSIIFLQRDPLDYSHVLTWEVAASS